MEWRNEEKGREREKDGEKEEGKEKRKGEESQVESKHRVEVWHLEMRYDLCDICQSNMKSSFLLESAWICRVPTELSQILIVHTPFLAELQHDN